MGIGDWEELFHCSILSCRKKPFDWFPRLHGDEQKAESTDDKKPAHEAAEPTTPGISISSGNQKEPLHEPKDLNKILLQKSGLEFREFGLIIIRSTLIGDRFSTRFAPVDDHPALGAAKVHADGLHQSAAGCRPVSRTAIIHMLAPEASWTVIATASMFQRLNLGTAVFTGEWFLAGDEGHEGRKPRKQKMPTRPTSSRQIEYQYILSTRGREKFLLGILGLFGVVGLLTY